VLSRKRPGSGAGSGGQTPEGEAKFAKAVDLTTQGQLAEAEALFKELLVVLPDVAEIHQNLGYIHAQRKEWANAEASYTRALELSPGNATSLSALAAVYESLGQHDKALALTEQAAAADPGNALAQFNRGVFLLNANQNAEAISAFEAALAVNPALVEAHFLLGRSSGPERRPQASGTWSVCREPQEQQNLATSKGLIAALKKKYRRAARPLAGVGPGRAPSPRPPRSGGRRGPLGSWTLPLGQRTRTGSITVASPRPKWARGSLQE
jgi:tetratricopeptide (TPR) repeat protein